MMLATREDRSIEIEVDADFLSQGLETSNKTEIVKDSDLGLEQHPIKDRDSCASEEKPCPSSPEIAHDSDGFTSAGGACKEPHSRRHPRLSVRNTFITVEDENPGDCRLLRRANTWHIGSMIDDDGIDGSENFSEAQLKISRDAPDESPAEKPLLDVVSPLSDDLRNDGSVKKALRPAYQAKRPAALKRSSSLECPSVISTPGTCSTNASSTPEKVLPGNLGAPLISSLVRTYSSQSSSACSTPGSSSVPECSSAFVTPLAPNKKASNMDAELFIGNSGAGLVRASSPEGHSALSNPGSSRVVETSTDLQHEAVRRPCATVFGAGTTDYATVGPQYFENIAGCAYMSREPSNMVVPVIAIPYTPMITFPAIPNVNVMGIAHQETRPNSAIINALPSIGSAGHHNNQCKPCAFGHDKCRNGANCEFCHICKPKQTGKHGRWILKRRKQADELQNDLLNLQSEMRQVQHPV